MTPRGFSSLAGLALVQTLSPGDFPSQVVMVLVDYHRPTGICTLVYAGRLYMRARGAVKAENEAARVLLAEVVSA